MTWEALLVPIALVGGLAFYVSTFKADGKRATRREDVDKALEYIDTCQEVIKRSKTIAALVAQRTSLPLNVVQLLFEVKRRELKGAADKMFVVKVWGHGEPHPSTFFGERYDYKTGKTKTVRKYASLRLALSDDAKGLFGIYSNRIRGGSIWKGLYLTDQGQKRLLDIILEVRGVAERAA